MRKLVDPSTKHSTAFYAALGVTVYDILRNGFSPWNTPLMALLAGIGTIGGIAAAQKLADKGPPPNPAE